MNRLVKAVTDATDVAIKEMMKSSQVGFTKARKKLDSLYDFVLKRVLDSATVQDLQH